MRSKHNQKKRTVVNIRRFKEWAAHNLAPDSASYQVIQREKDELALEEAVAKTDMICALIDSIDSKSLKKATTGRTLEVS